MIVITADQVDSRSTPDLGAATLDTLNEAFADHLLSGAV